MSENTPKPNVNRPQDTNNPKPGKQPSREANKKEKEIGGPKGPEPTRYGDWEKNGRCVDF